MRLYQYKETDFFLSTTVPAEDISAIPIWDSGTVYAVGDQVQINDVWPVLVFESRVDNNKGNYPLRDTKNWKYIKTPNEQAMFDAFLETQTIDSKDITVTLDVSNCSQLTVSDVECESFDVSVVENANGTTILQETVYPRNTSASDYYYYFFDPIENKKLFLIEFPLYGDSTATVTFKQAGTDDVRVGFCRPSRQLLYADTVYTPKVSIKDFSIMVRDKDTGYAYFSQGYYAKKVEFDFWFSRNKLDLFWLRLSGLRGKLICLDGNNQDGDCPNTDFNSLINVGFYKDFQLLFTKPPFARGIIELEGMI